MDFDTRWMKAFENIPQRLIKFSALAKIANGRKHENEK